MDYAAHLRDTARHLIRMADDPLSSGKNGHAAFRLQELLASEPMYRVLPDMVREERARMRGESKA